ncbi:PleD family two-component response regulator [Halanaerobacter jeridensis]|uniref:PleD family two-component response regulator n=1 Tax=Halanaerobacter jeridensis TaxID=706427 RepID=A0A939BNR5_9FIRM|nr:PleD family two-component response regulator [Halanaerobacter jeridensis]
MFSNNSDYISLLQRYKDLETKLFIDDLTGVGNKNHIKKRLEESLIELKKYDWL